MKIERVSNSNSVVLRLKTSACFSGVKGYMLRNIDLVDSTITWPKTINWPAIGSVSIAQAREFAAAINAVCDALEQEPTREEK